MDVTVGTDSWVTIAEADAYLKSRFGAAKVWNDELDHDSKVAAVVTAYKQLNNSGLFSFPEESTQAMKDAQSEMALFILLHQEDMDQRSGLQAQGVVEAGIVQEKYDLSRSGGIFIPPFIEGLLANLVSTAAAYGVNKVMDDEKVT